MDLFNWKCWNKVHLGIFSIQNAEIKYGYGIIPLRMQIKWTASDLFHWKDQNEVQLGIYSHEKY